MPTARVHAQLSLDSRHIVITGGTGALGSAVVERLLREAPTCHIPCLHESEHKRFPFTKLEHVKITTGVDLTDEACSFSLLVGIERRPNHAIGVTVAAMMIAATTQALRQPTAEISAASPSGTRAISPAVTIENKPSAVPRFSVNFSDTVTVLVEKCRVNIL